MKGKFICLFILIFSAFTAAGVISCAKAPQKLEKPQNVNVEKRVITWDKVDGATDYTVKIRDEEFKTAEPRFELYFLTDAGDYYYQVKACGNGKKYTDSSWVAGATILTQAPEHDYDELKFEYTLLEDKSGYEVSRGEADLAGVITIPDYFGDYPVKKIAEKAFYNLAYGRDMFGRLDVIDFPESNKNLCNDKTTGVNLPSHLEEIGAQAFSCMIALEEIIIPDSVVTIGYWAFSIDVSLKRVKLPAGLKILPSRCFDNAPLQEIVLPETLEEIGGEALSCRDDSVSWSKHVTSDLSTITIPETVRRIGAQAFLGRENLKTVNYRPDNVESVSWGILNETAWYNDQPDGFVFLDKEQTIVIDYKNMPENYSMTIPSTVKCLADRAFNVEKNLKSVTIPGNIQIYGEELFAGCKSLSTVVLPQNIPSIARGMFRLAGIKSITLPKSVVSLEPGAFDGSKLERIELPPDLKTIGVFAFGGCPDLKEVVFNEQLEVIDVTAFVACQSLTKVVLPKSVKSIGKEAFANCRQLKSVILSSSLKSIGKEAFAKCSQLEFVILPSSIESIDQRAFSDCDNLTAIFYEGNVGNWDKIETYNDLRGKDNFSEATIYCFSYIKPTSGNYWHYAADGVTPEIW